MDEKNINEGYIVFVDTGGTFTDAVIVDKNGDFELGKLPTTPDDPSRGFLGSINEGLSKIRKGLDSEKPYSDLAIVGWGTTLAVNALINRSGPKLGLIVNKGFEHVMTVGRGKQSWITYGKADIIHARTHRRDNPLIPISLIEGVRERISSTGDVEIPLYENEVSEAVYRLLNNGVEAIVICFLFSYLNDKHEKKAKQIVTDILQKVGKDILVLTSSEICPVERELPWMNTAVAEAFVRQRLINALREINRKLQVGGYKHSLQVMQVTGGLATIDTIKMVETMNSGPVAGLMGGLFISKEYGFDNLITTDVGGTSFDVGLVNNGMVTTESETVAARMILGISTPSVYSIGAGGGTLIRLDPVTKRLQVGPDSAEAVPGPISYNRGGKIPTITDCDLILGYLDPGYFLGGSSLLKINKNKAFKAVKEQLADPLNLSVEEVALGARKILDNRMRDTIISMVTSRGFSMSKYHVLVFGGAGGTHCAGYTDRLMVKGIMIFPYSSAFCAFGGAASDFQHNFVRALNAVVPQAANDSDIARACKQLDDNWAKMEELAYEQMEKDGFNRNQVQLKHTANVRYGRQLDDLTVQYPESRLKDVKGWKELIDIFEKTYEEMYAKSAKYSQAGYEILQIGLVAIAPKIKPKLKRHELSGEKPSDKAFKSPRKCYFDGGWLDTLIIDWSELKAGNRVNGPAVVESRTTNIVVPE